MKLRAKLVLSFLGLAVVPLAAITLYSYHTSLRALRAAARERGLPLRLDLRWERTRCREPMQKLYVDFRGNVTPCCRIHHEVLAGNIFDSSLDAVWFGPTLRRWRRALRRREEHPRICVERCHLGLRPHR